MGEIIVLGVKAGIVEKSGSWFSYDSTRIGQGRENVREFLKQNPDFTLHHVEQDDGPWHPDDTPVDTAWVAGGWDPSARPVGLYV